MRPIADDLGLNLAAVGSGASLIFAMMATSGILNGPELDKGHIRRTMLVGAGMLALALIAASLATDAWQLGLCCIVVGICIPMLGPLSGATLVGKVATEGRGKAMGIMNIGAPAGSVAFALLAGFLIEAVGWRATLSTFGAIVGTVAVPWILAVLPRSIGEPTSDANAPGLTPKALLATADFRLIAIAQGIAAGTAMGWAVHLAPYLQGVGATTAGASSVIATSSGVGVLGGLLFGHLVDRNHPRTLMVVLVLTNATGFLFLSFEPTLVLASGAAIGIGFLGGGILPIYTTLLARRFGPESLGRAFGLTNLFMLPMGFGLPPVAGYVATHSGSYTAALWGIVAIYGLAIFSLLRVRGPFDR